jgi:hypothetical protein
VERNVVITQWDWADPKAYLHDLVSTDRKLDPRTHRRKRLASWEAGEGFERTPTSS